MLEAALQALQSACEQCDARSCPTPFALTLTWRAPGARRDASAPPADVARLESVARAVGMAIERMRLPPAALLLDDLLRMQVGGADAKDVARRMAGAFAGGLQPAAFAASARLMVTALDAEERCARRGVRVFKD